MRSVFITGTDRGIGFALCKQFLDKGWKVFAGHFMKDWSEMEKIDAETLAVLKEKWGTQLSLVQIDIGTQESVDRAAAQMKEETDCLDMIVHCAGIYQNETEAAMYNCLNVNTMGAIRVTEALLPLMENGEKRLCFFSSEASSISLAHRDGDMAYCVSKTCLNMAVRLMFEKLRPRGYHFRLYHPGWVHSYMIGEVHTLGNFAPEDTAAVAYEQFSSDRNWEDVLAMSDISGEIWPF